MKRFWWHWQNLKEDTPKALLNGRAWLHMGKAVLGCQWVIPTSNFGISFGTDDGEHQINAHIACGLFAFYFHLEGVRWLYKHLKEREISFSVYDWSLHWRLWVQPHEWHSKTPKWRDGWFGIPDFFLGKARYTKVDQEPIPAVVSLPEADYPVMVTFFTQTWKRPRWPVPKVSQGAYVDSEQGIPIPGKGENSWDCEDTAYLSIGTSATTVEEALADIVERVNERRERYGGKGWFPEKVK